jgi:hypothetical protein
MLGSRMLLLIDEDVPDSVASFFRERGHDVRLVRDLFLPATPDPVIAALGNELGAIIVTWNHKDFKKLAAQIPIGQCQRFRNLGRINFLCRETRGRQRAEANIESIEFEYHQAQRRPDRRLLIEITETSFRVLK